MRRALAAIIAGSAALPLAASLAAGPPSTGPEILAQRCLSCHDAQKKTAGVDLSTVVGIRAVGANGPDDPAKNRLVRMVVTGKMPPSGKLPAGEVVALRAWVRAGAPLGGAPLQAVKISDQPLWSLQPVRRPTVPRTEFDKLARNAVDRFIFAKLEARGLEPSPGADRLSLIRRVTLDLTGLPPTPEEVHAFFKDRSPDAYRKVVDRLLASPAYGERWGRYWLDVVRFGESNGYEQNHLRANAWPYRDYVIRSFNQDKPYDQFVKEQLAGDVLGKGDPAVEVGTGFLVAGVHDTVGNQTEEGTRQQRANDLDDMVATTSETFLGLTAGCAKCHDHKFDPIPQRDYYRLAAVFAGVRHGERPLGSEKDLETRRQEADAVQRDLRLAQISLAGLNAEARANVLRQEGVPPARPPANPRLNVEEFAPVTARFVRFSISITNDGAQPCLDELEVYGPESDRNLALASGGAKASASSLLPGYAIHQIPHLNDGRYGNDWSWISNEPHAGWAQIEFPQPARINRVVWSRDGSLNPRFADRLPTDYRVEVSEDGKTWKAVATGSDRAANADSITTEKLEQALNPDQRARRKQLAARVEELRGRWSGAAQGQTAYVGTFSAPDPTFVLKRGDVMQRGDEVTPGALSRIPGFPGEVLASAGDAQSESKRRLGLADWLTDPRNPLTARVMVNRIWHGHFGRGIVPTPSDFGHNGEPPSHPELLDWLADDFARNGWTLKRLHRMIVTSYTYCQSSASDAKGMAADAGDVLLWRMPLRRLDAEEIRDSILAVSGKLDRRMGGPGYTLYKYRVVNVAIYEPLEQYGPETWRRSVYRTEARGIREDLLGAFDCPESSQRTPRRPSTTTALQALSLLNGPFAVQQAGFMAERVRKEAGANPASQIIRAFVVALDRAPMSGEYARAEKLFDSEGLEALCRGLLNTNEFLYY